MVRTTPKYVSEKFRILPIAAEALMEEVREWSVCPGRGDEPGGSGRVVRSRFDRSGGGAESDWMRRRVL